ncbi:Crp/Fnr family transcriptional regulator [Flavihumibacter sp. RY-1]|uniref:Crp/Fnr family transcriptional regulator n=1 Tax=Flavihumibacter fluminis TaxID=2909236 RepID=A0ABS9BCL0_9BACT|nr:cyclic nucleotide-binding domain-containing protein [Flavihumibacter fluminis]MCF1713391.1 Crp/Fnr family transcriptional regulator [Flavihumibacter fluminis]
MKLMGTNVFAYINRFVELTDAERKVLRQQIQIMTCVPKQVLTNIGELEQHTYFIEKGLVRKYFYRGQEEITVQISKEGQLISSSVSFLSGVPSDFVIETMEPCTLAFITKSGMETLYEYSVKFEKMGRLIILEWMLLKEKTDTFRMISSPKERFSQFIRENPDLLSRVPQKYLASLLDVKPETFSRFKKQYILNGEE